MGIENMNSIDESQKDKIQIKPRKIDEINKQANKQDREEPQKAEHTLTLNMKIIDVEYLTQGN